MNERFSLPATASLLTLFEATTSGWSGIVDRLRSSIGASSCRITVISEAGGHSLCESGEAWPAGVDPLGLGPFADTANDFTGPAAAPTYCGMPLIWPDGGLFGTLDLMLPPPAYGTGGAVAMIELAQAALEADLAMLARMSGMSGAALASRLDEERLQRHARRNGMGLWDYDVAADRLACDAGWHEIVGDSGDPGVLKTIAYMRRIVHWADVKLATAIDQPTLGHLISLDRPYACTFRILRADGALRVVRSEAFLVAASDGRAARAVGAMIDITDGGYQPDSARILDDLIRRAGKLARAHCWLLDAYADGGQGLRLAETRTA